jgi:class 3 adenylate cyclase
MPGVTGPRLGRERARQPTPPDRRIEFRIRVNLGDVILENGDDIFRDGVNVAARLEWLQGRAASPCRPRCAILKKRRTHAI